MDGPLLCLGTRPVAWERSDPGRIHLGPGADAKEGVGYSKRFNAPEAHLSAMQPPPHAGIGPPLAPAEERIGARGKNNACSGTVFKVD